MSTEALFARVSYPRLAGEADDAVGDSIDHATARGFAAGYAAGARSAASEAALAAAESAARADRVATDTRASVLSALRALETAANHAHSVRRPLIAESDSALAAAALELAEAILGKELANHESAAAAAIARALAVAPNDEVLVLRMHPADIEILGPVPEALASAKLVGDAKLERGDAILETPVGTVDARLGSAVERARTILLGGAS